jgi:hypothetical protein
LGQIDLFAQSFEKREANGLFELLDLHRNSGLGEEKFLGRTGEAESFCDPLEYLELS